MNSQNEQLVQMAIAEAKLGNRKKAKAILVDLVGREPESARAWYLLSQVADNSAQAQACLKNVLELEPDNLQARQRLASYQSEPQALKPKPSSGGILSWVLLVVVVCVGVPLCVLATTTGYTYVVESGMLLAQEEVRATVDQALAATLAKIPTYTLVPTSTATPTPLPTATSTATPTATSTPTITPTPTATVNQTAVLQTAQGGPLQCVPWNNPVQPGIVTRVIDGDPIVVFVDGQLVTVRYIGIDAPETVYPGQAVEYFGPQAKEKNRQLVEGKAVFLVRDVSDTDQYNRLLRYVMVGSLYGQFVNDELVRQGYASASAYPPDVACAESFLAAQHQAAADGLGLWGTKRIVTFTPTVTPDGTAPPPSRSGGEVCDPAYPTVCIPPLPPDLSCKDIPQFKNFTVLPPDPHRFDGDGNGVGCEG
jgi:micrococcal nuclease